jgi:hypothetical protein
MDPHLASVGHISKARETAAADEQIGESESARRFTISSGFMTNHLNKAQFANFWGIDLEHMPALVLDKLKAGSRIKIDIRKKFKKFFTYDDVVKNGLGFGAVSYPGSGKYSDSRTQRSVSILSAGTTCPTP